MMLRWAGRLSAAGALLIGSLTAAAAACSSFGEAAEPATGADGGEDVASDGAIDAATSDVTTCLASTEKDAGTLATCNGIANTNLANNPLHCGKCGRACPSCVGGLCVPQPVGENVGASHIALTPTDLVSSTLGLGGTVSRRPLDGGPRVELATCTPAEGVLGVVTDEARIYVNAQLGLYALPIGASTGNAPRTAMAPNNNTKFGLAQTSTLVVWTTAGAGLELWAKADGARVSVAGDPSLDGVAGVVADDKAVFWIGHGLVPEGGLGDNRLFRRTPDGNVTTRLSKLVAPGGLALDATHVYWANTDAKEILRANRDGDGPPEVVARWSGDQPHVRAILVDRAHVYWVTAVAYNNYGDTQLLRAPTACGGDVERIAVRDHASNLAVDATSIYWGSLGGIFKIPK